MKRRQSRLSVIVDILSNNSISSQGELKRLLALRGYAVTQATLSRDLRMLGMIKVPAGADGYRYVVAETPAAPAETPAPGEARRHPSALSLALSGNIIVIKTRNGYASGLAYDIDMMHTPLIAGTIAGGDTVFAVVSDDTPGDDLYRLLATILPAGIVEPVKDKLLRYNTLNQ